MLQAPGLAPSTGPPLHAVNRPISMASSQPTFEELMSEIASQPVLPSAQVSTSSQVEIHERGRACLPRQVEGSPLPNGFGFLQDDSISSAPAPAKAPMAGLATLQSNRKFAAAFG